MAKIGLRDFRYGILTEGADGTPAYDGVHTPGKAVSCSVQITNNSAKLFADDGLAESDNSFQSGTVTMGIDDADPETLAELLGHTVSSGEVISNSNDIAPYVGLGRIITKIVGGTKKYTVKFLRKVKFSEPSDDDTTKGESVEFGTVSIEGDVSTLKNGDWKAEETFTSYEDALAYLEGLLSPATEKLTGLALGTGSVATLAPAFSAATTSYTVTFAGSSGTDTLVATAGTGVAIAFFKGDTAKQSGTASVTQTLSADGDTGAWTIEVGTGAEKTTYNITVAVQQ